MNEPRPDDLLDMIINQYLNSHEFNGLFMSPRHAGWADSARHLVTSGLIEIVSEQDSDNVHLRPWQTQKSAQDQIQEINKVVTGLIGGVGLYPTSLAMRDRLDPMIFRDQPYKRRIAEGSGCLNCAFFKFEVLEPYRNDPQYQFTFEDFGGSFYTNSISSEDENKDDQSEIIGAGFAYEFPEGEDGPIIRRVSVFLRNLAKLPPLHQQRWFTYEINECEGLKPHPIWLARQMGKWVDGVGPFERFIFELESLNDLHLRAFGCNILCTTERPREFGWILRPSQQEYDAFIQILDKLLSENLSHDAFNQLGVVQKDEYGQSLGTLNRLDQFLKSKGISEDQRKAGLKSLRNVREQRRKPAHSLRTNVTDINFIRLQVDLLQETTQSLKALRGFWQVHPANRDWNAKSSIESGPWYKM